MVAGGGVAVNKDVEEIFENIRDVVAVHQDDVAAMGMRCQGDGWKVKNGVCFPFSNAKNEIQGWRMP